MRACAQTLLCRGCGRQQDLAAVRMVQVLPAQALRDTGTLQPSHRRPLEGLLAAQTTDALGLCQPEKVRGHNCPCHDSHRALLRTSRSTLRAASASSSIIPPSRKGSHCGQLAGWLPVTVLGRCMCACMRGSSYPLKDLPWRALSKLGRAGWQRHGMRDEGLPTHAACVCSRSCRCLHQGPEAGSSGFLFLTRTSGCASAGRVRHEGPGRRAPIQLGHTRWQGHGMCDESSPTHAVWECARRAGAA